MKSKEILKTLSFLCSQHWPFSFKCSHGSFGLHIDGLVQERRNNAMELCLSCTNSSICKHFEWLNSLSPGRCNSNFKCAIPEYMLQIKFMGTSCEIALRWRPQNTFDKKLTFVQVMAWCCQATSHYFNQCWPRSKSPYGIIRLQWVKKDCHPCLKCQAIMLWFMQIINVITIWV